MMPIRVLIVDDSAMMRSFLRDTLCADPGIEVVGTAADPFIARNKIKELAPDVLTLDIEMPGMDGLTFLENLMRLRPMRVVMVSSLSQRGADIALQALEMGAIDFIGKPNEPLSSGWNEFTVEIAEIVKNAAKAAVPYIMPDVSPVPNEGMALPHMIAVIGGSTGSVSALQHILSALPETAPAMAVAIHMPPMFTRQFASRLNGLSAMTVAEAEDGMRLLPVHVYIAPGDRHLTIRRVTIGYVCRVESGPRISGHIPSVDVLFESAANASGSNAIGIVLTGMGRDGAAGLRALRDAGQNAPAEPVQSYPRPSSLPRLLNPKAGSLTTAEWVSFGCRSTRLVGQNCMLKHRTIRRSSHSRAILDLPPLSASDVGRHEAAYRHRHGACGGPGTADRR